MSFDPDREFIRFRVTAYSGPDGRGWRIVDRTTDQHVDWFPTGNGQKQAYVEAQARAAELNLDAYRKASQ